MTGYCIITGCTSAPAAGGYTVCPTHLEEARARPARVLSTSDAVSSPPHYTRFPDIEVIQLTRHLNFNRGNAIKYLARAGEKRAGDETSEEADKRDIKKALWYIADECQRLGVEMSEIQKIVEKHK